MLSTLSLQCKSTISHLNFRPCNKLTDFSKASRCAGWFFSQNCTETNQATTRKLWHSTKPPETSCIKKLPIGIQSIHKVLTDGYIYADKTEYAQEIIEGYKHYRLCRPDGLGKSLFVDTLKEIFKGNKELFRDCKIYKSNYAWKPHPVVHLDFSKISSGTPGALKAGLKALLLEMSQLHEISIEEHSMQFQLMTLMRHLSKQGRVVVLIDEYDQPLVNNLNRPDVLEENQQILTNFLTTLKSLDEYVKLTFVTSVYHFSQTSIFSGPNHLIDITMDPHYATMVGYTVEEVRSCFSERIAALAKKRGQTEEAVVKELDRWCGGYRFSQKEVTVYSPLSTLQFLDTEVSYSTKTSVFIGNQLKKRPQSIMFIQGAGASEYQLSIIDRLDQIDLLPPLFQAGYLTVQNYRENKNFYSLGFTNEGVRKFFFDSFLQGFIGIDFSEINRAVEEARKDLEELNLDSFVTKMNAHFAKTAHHSLIESQGAFYQALLFTFLERSGIPTQLEFAFKIGRIDLIAEVPKGVWIFALKEDKTVDAASHQAQTQKYREKYKGKEVLVMEINVDGSYTAPA
jgi:hypothetical protein